MGATTVVYPIDFGPLVFEMPLKFVLSFLVGLITNLAGVEFCSRTDELLIFSRVVEGTVVFLPFEIDCLVVAMVISSVVSFSVRQMMSERFWSSESDPDDSSHSLTSSSSRSVQITLSVELLGFAGGGVCWPGASVKLSSTVHEANVIVMIRKSNIFS